jgi:hypothetical protein
VGLAYIRELYMALGRPGLILTLHGHFDETGDAPDPGCKAVGFGGCAAEVEMWERFEPEWSSVLQEFRVPPYPPGSSTVWFHAVDAEHSRNAFDGWSIDRVRSLRSVLLNVILSRVRWFVGCIIELSAYRSHPELPRDEQVDPYFTCYQASVDELARLGSLFLPTRKTVEVFVAKKKKYVERTISVHEEMLRRSPYAARLPSLPVFRTPQELVQLQAADFVAFELSRYQRGGPVRPEFRRMRESGKWRVKHRPENRLFQGYLSGSIGLDLDNLRVILDVESGDVSS